MLLKVCATITCLVVALLAHILRKLLSGVKMWPDLTGLVRPLFLREIRSLSSFLGTWKMEVFLLKGSMLLFGVPVLAHPCGQEDFVAGQYPVD